MTTLTSAPLAPLLARLFKEAEAATSPAAAGLSPDERARLLGSKTEYVDFYGRLKDLWLAVSPETGTLLYMLARSSGARVIIEFGTSFGISTLYLAAALRDNGGGRLITTEFEPSKVMRAKANLTEGEAAGGLAAGNRTKLSAPALSSPAAADRCRSWTAGSPPGCGCRRRVFAGWPRHAP